MKINLIIPTFYPAVIYGGPVFSTFNTSKELVKFDDLKLQVSTTNANMNTYLDLEKNKLLEIEEKIFVKYYHDTKLNKISIPFLFNVWKDIKANDLIHIQSIFSTQTPISLFFAKLFKKEIILSPRGSLAPWILNRKKKRKDIWLNYLIKPFIKDITWHATAEQEKNEILSLFSNAKVKIIPNGIDLDDYKIINKLSKKEYLKKFINQKLEVENIIVSMGRIHAKKGFDILVKAFNELDQKYKKSVVLIAGEDENELSNLKDLCKKLNIENKVFFIGKVLGQDKIDFLANADLFVLPSHNENFGNVYAESLASGTPIIASTDTPWSEVEEYNCGKWVKNSVKDTKDAIEYMLSQDLERMAENGKNYISKFEWKNVAKNFHSLFKRILESK